jgi:hypothetical protein
VKLSVIRQGSHQGVRHDGLDQSALSELLDALHAGGDLDVVRDGSSGREAAGLALLTG